MRYLLSIVLPLVSALSLALAGCGTDDTAGGLGDRCSGAAECASGNCNLTGDFPGGLCTQACTKASDCPAGFACISNSGGICMETCASNADCSRSTAGWVCREQSREESSGTKALVCSGP